MSWRSKVGGPALLAAAVLAAVGCGVPTGEDSFDNIANDEVPFRLAEQSTTTSTTTTTLPPPTAPPTTLPDAPETTAETTTTTLPTETVVVYHLSRDGLQPVPGELPQGYGIAQLVALLEAGPPPGVAGVGLDTLIQPGLIGASSVEGGVVTVDLVDEVYDEIRPGNLRPAMAQIVLTFTANLRGIGQVSFTEEEVPLRVPKGNGILAEEGEPLAFDDYSVLLAEPTVGPATAETTTTTSTTLPAPPATDDVQAADGDA